jgi:hypothetical protein
LLLELEDFLEEEDLDLEELALVEDFLTFDLYREEDEGLDFELESEPERYLVFDLYREDDVLPGYFLTL